MSGLRFQVSGFRTRVRWWARPIASTFLALWLTSLASAQTARQPEPTPSAAARMFEQLNTTNWILQAEALDYLSHYDVPDALGPVKAIVKNSSSNRWLQARGMVALSRISPAQAGSLATLCSTKPVVELRVAAAEICYDLPAANAAPIIKKLVAEKTPLVKYNALAAHARHLGKDAWQAAAPAMTNIPVNCIEPATRALGWIGTEPALATLGELARESKSIPAMRRGLQGVKNPDLAPFYLELMTVAKGTLPIADVWSALESCGNDAVIAACRQALASGDQGRLSTVAHLMSGYFIAPELGEALKSALVKVTDPATLKFGLAALSSADADLARDALLANLDHKDAGSRTLAIRSLAKDKAVNVYDVLEKLLADPVSSVRVDALRALQNASAKHVPRERVVAYFESSLLSKDKATREAAMATIMPNLTTNNGEVALGVLTTMQIQYGLAGTEPLMRAVFPLVPEEKAAAALDAQGYVTRWHVVGMFPAGGSAWGDDVDGMATVYPPEKSVDLNQSFTIAYNTVGQYKRLGKRKTEQDIGWVKATVTDGDGILQLAQGGRLQLAIGNGASYLFTEIVVPRQTDVRMEFLFNSGSASRIWLNGKDPNLGVDTYKKWNNVYRTGRVSGKTTLNAGKNRILLKLVAGTVGRTVRLRLTDPEGKLVEFSYE